MLVLHRVQGHGLKNTVQLRDTVCVENLRKKCQILQKNYEILVKIPKESHLLENPHRYDHQRDLWPLDHLQKLFNIVDILVRINGLRINFSSLQVNYNDQVIREMFVTYRPRKCWNL